MKPLQRFRNSKSFQVLNEMEGKSQLACNKSILQQRTRLQKNNNLQSPYEITKYLKEEFRGNIHDLGFDLPESPAKYQRKAHETYSNEITKCKKARETQYKIYKRYKTFITVVLYQKQLDYDENKARLLKEQEINRQKYLKEKIVCSCGKSVSKKHYRRHQLTH